MAIGFVRIQPMNMRSDLGMCAIVGYVARRTIEDRRLGKTFTFRASPADLAHAEVLLPDGAPAEWSDAEFFANEVDRIEAARTRRLTDRRRWPQVCFSAVVALPPDRELTLDEAIELTHRIADRLRDAHELPMHVAIHDPALVARRGNPVNRHAHFSIALRPIGSRHKVRDFIARPRHGHKKGKPAVYVAEGASWPDIIREVLTAFFAEVGSDVVVDPPAPLPDRHWPEHLLEGDLADEFRSKRRAGNRAVISGNAATLIAMLLRGRSAMRAGELHRLLARILDEEGERRLRADEILSDPSIVTLDAPEERGAPRFLTTKDVLEKVSVAARFLDAAAIPRSQSHLHRQPVEVIIGLDDHEQIASRICSLLAEEARRTPEAPWDRVVIVGTGQADCACILSKLTSEYSPEVMGLSSALSDIESLTPRSLIIVPKAERIVDQHFADILLAVNDSSCRLLIGFNLSRHAALGSPLAAYAVERLAQRQLSAFAATEEMDASLFLRAGLIGPAIEILGARGCLEFTLADESDPHDDFDFIVCDNVNRLSTINARMRAARIASGRSGDPTTIHTKWQPLECAPGEWIAFEATSYEHQPPILRAGRLARIVSADAGKGLLTVEIPGSSETIVALSRVRVRSAYALTIREGRFAPAATNVRIEVTTARHLWAALLLASSRSAARVSIAPTVAQDIAGLLKIGRSCSPGALPFVLENRVDPSAENHAVLSSLFETVQQSTVVKESFDEFPKPSAKQQSRPIVVVAPLPPLHERVRAVVSRHSERLGLEFMRAVLMNGAVDREGNFVRIMAFIGDHEGLAAVIARGMYEGRRRKRITKDIDEEFDLPEEFDGEAPADWNDVELWKLSDVLENLSFAINQKKIAPLHNVEEVNNRVQNLENFISGRPKSPKETDESDP
ncbi:MobA/MobL family protein [Methylosinus sporium]|uniref:MobA/MobL family protein n=1 Tax=Methylosinus sporium TaxID=428 RepID=UPI00383BDBE2